MESINKDNSFYNWCINNNHQDLLNEWDIDKNGDVTPYNTSYGTDRKVWWIKHYDDPKTGKHFDFSWEASVSHRKGGRGCPYLSNPAKKIYPGFNDLATTNKELAEEWNTDENDKLNIKITEVSAGSTKEVFWNCKIHGIYKATIAHRSSGKGCPFCAGKQVKIGMNDLATVRPDLAKEWDTEKNGIGPETVTIGCITKYWWKCSEGHSWQASPNNRTNNKTGCPICSNKVIIPGVNDLATLSPGIAKEWNFEKNGALKPIDVAIKSNRTVWWKCFLGHEYQAKISTRVIYNTGCPICNSERETSFPEQAIFYYIKKNFKCAISRAQFDWLANSEIDIYIPQFNVGIEYDGGHWHSNVDKDLKKDLLCQRNGIDLIRIRDSKCPTYQTNAFTIQYGENFECKTFKDALKFLFEYLNSKYSLGLTIDIDIDRDYTSIIQDFIFGEKDNNLADGRPDIAKEWDYDKNGTITPRMVSLYSNKKVWFICPKCGYSYHMTINNRTGEKKSNCPACAGKVVVKGNNDLATTNPELLNEWDYEKNSVSPFEVTMGTHKKVWWKCSKGHSWETQVYVRAKMKCGCPYCSGQRVLPGENDLLTVNPKLCEEWDYNKNELPPSEYLPKSNKKVWWICKECGHSWQTAISHRVEGKGCPKCNRGGNYKTGFLSSNKELMLDWNFSKNQNLNPNKLALGSNKYVWWKCHICGYEWTTKVGNRGISKRGCPCCSNKVIVKGKNDLATLRPDIAKEWNYEKNGELKPTEFSVGSGKKVWWICPKGHEYQATILHRTYGDGTNCPKCNDGRQTSFAEQAVYFYVKQVYPDAINRYRNIFGSKMELDIFIPTINIAIEYDGEAWHDENHMDRERRKYKLCHDNHITLIRLREKEFPLGSDIADEAYIYEKLYEHKTLEYAIWELIRRITFRSYTIKYDINIERDKVKILEQMAHEEKDSFEKLYPLIAKEWHPTKNGILKPNMFKSHSDHKVWWLCKNCGNEYEATIGHRVEGTGCPKCGIEKSKLAKVKAVEMFDLKTGGVIKEFESIAEAGRQMHISTGNISAVCRGERPYASGYGWRYKK